MLRFRFFTDRSLGNSVVPRALVKAGWQVTSMAERYGETSAQQLADIDWIQDCSEAGEVLLTGDKRIAKVPLEAEAVVAATARVFAIGSSQLTGAQKAGRYLRHQDAIFRYLERHSGPFVVSVTGTDLRTLKLFG